MRFGARVTSGAASAHAGNDPMASSQGSARPVPTPLRPVRRDSLPVMLAPFLIRVSSVFHPWLRLATDGTRMKQGSFSPAQTEWVTLDNFGHQDRKTIVVLP